MTDEPIAPLQLPPPVDDDDISDVLAIDTNKPLRLSAEGIRCLQKATGRSMTELLTDDADESNKMQVLAFAELFRRYSRSGHMPDAGVLWEQAGRAYIPLVGDTPQPDPLDSDTSTAGLPSADTGE